MDSLKFLGHMPAIRWHPDAVVGNAEAEVRRRSRPQRERGRLSEMGMFGVFTFDVRPQKNGGWSLAMPLVASINTGIEPDNLR